MSDAHMKRARVITIVAATTMALACGTNYAFSAWGPAYAERMGLNSKQQNLIGMFGNLGMYGTGIPTGMMVDRYGPRAGGVFGSLTVAVGYFAIYRAYVGGPGSMPLWLVCFFTILTGTGGAAAFGGAIKTAAMNFPNNRGAATAFPLSGFGLSAFFFSIISTVMLGGDTAGLLLFLSLGCFFMIAVATVFLRIYPNSPAYLAVPTEPETKFRAKMGQDELGMDDGPDSAKDGLLEPPDSFSMAKLDAEGSKLADDDGDEEAGVEVKTPSNGSLYADVRGWKLLRCMEFYQEFFLLGCLTGVGLMTINNIGNNTQALWTDWAPEASKDMIRARQKVLVSMISLGSFAGRLLSGIGSDWIVRHNFSRMWCLVLSAMLFSCSQFYALVLGNPNFLSLLAGTTGIAYGFLFGCFPSIVADTFGPNGLAQNWGTMTIAPILFGNVFNYVYGSIYDANSVANDDGTLICKLGLQCYSGAYWLTLVATGVGMVVALWSIKYGATVRDRKRQQAFVQGHIS